MTEELRKQLREALESDTKQTILELTELLNEKYLGVIEANTLLELDSVKANEHILEWEDNWLMEAQRDKMDEYLNEEDFEKCMDVRNFISDL